MKTLTFKIPVVLEHQLNTLAQERGSSKSKIVREALIAYLLQDSSPQGSFLEMAEDLAGIGEGPADLSVNKAYLESYGK